MEDISNLPPDHPALEANRRVQATRTAFDAATREVVLAREGLEAVIAATHVTLHDELDEALRALKRDYLARKAAVVQDVRTRVASQRTAATNLLGAKRALQRAAGREYRDALRAHAIVVGALVVK